MKAIKRAFSLLLCLALLCAVVALGAQAKEKSCGCGVVPTIWVPGIGGGFIVDYGTAQQRSIGMMDEDRGAEEWIKDLLPVLTNVIAAAATQSWDKGADALHALGFGLLGHLQMDERGQSVYPVTMRATVNPAQDHTQNRHYQFDYDWRADPMQTAAALNDYVAQVKKATGHKQVILEADSEGGLIVMAYFAQFGYADVEHFISRFCAHHGVSMVGELLNGNIALTAPLAKEYATNLLRVMTPDTAKLLPLIDFLAKTKLLDVLVNALSMIVKNTAYKLYTETLIPLAAQWPALWGFVPDEYYESAKKLMLSDPKYDDFKKMIDNFHYKAGSQKADKLIKDANKVMKVSIIASYGFPIIPLTPNVGTDTDALIDTARESCGATTAGYGNTFAADYAQKKNDGHNHISPDNRVDASTCLLPDQTWFIKYAPHFTPDHYAFFDFLYDSKRQPTVFTDAEFPQFMTRQADGTFIPTAP